MLLSCNISSNLFILLSQQCHRSIYWKMIVEFVATLTVVLPLCPSTAKIGWIKLELTLSKKLCFFFFKSKIHSNSIQKKNIGNWNFDN